MLTPECNYTEKPEAQCLKNLSQVREGLVSVGSGVKVLLLETFQSRGTLSLDDTARDCVICKELPASVAGGFMSVGQESQEVRPRVGAALSILVVSQLAVGPAAA